MFDQIREDTIYTLLYAVGMAMAAMASIYLLFRRGNAFAADVTPPRRLRRWTAAFFGVIAAGHLWYLPAAMLTSADAIMLSFLIGELLDCMLTIPLTLIVMLCMLQDRQRPLWPVGVMVAPLAVGLVVCAVTRSNVLFPWLYGYFLLMAVGFTIYMVRALRRYGRWLRDNYADLEHKEVWQSLVVLALMLLLFVFYTFLGNVTLFLYAYQLFDIVFLGYLLWRVETLNDLSVPVNDVEEEADVTVDVEDKDLPLSIHNHIGVLLQQHCIDKQLYLQHDLNIIQLAKAIGTNRLYLSQYFSSQGTTYNNYINDLRINHFIHLCREAADAQRSYTIQQLALESGYRSYSTFRDVIKRKTGKSVRAWMKEFGEP